MSSAAHRLRLTARITPLVVTAIAGLSAFAATVPAHASGPVSYVALGDSYSSGHGAGDYSDGSCLQSANAYPVLWHDEHGGSFSNETCSGATTSDVINSQLGALSASTTLVTITIGGNDVGFESVMTTCVLDSQSSCLLALSQAEQQAQASLPGALDTVLSDISRLAPNADVVVLGYPQFYDLSMSPSCFGLSTTDRTAINQGISLLDSLISAAADQYGDTFVDVNPYFSGHQICDWNSYLNGIDWLDLGASFHPTADGQQYGYLSALNSAAG